VRVHSLTFSYIPGSMKCDSWASLLAHNLANPCLGREPKARVATHPFFKIFHQSTPLNPPSPKVIKSPKAKI